MTYDNYIFDLYGTLVDIHTDEESKELWIKMTDYIKREFGKTFKPAQLHKLYKETDALERKKLAARSKADHPEIRISWVWDKILEIKDPTPNDGPIDTPSPEIQKLCTFFRETSRDRMKLFSSTEETLKELRDRGKKVFLLSNAQRAFTYKEIQETGLVPYFDDILISSDEMIMKPQKEFLELLIEKHSLDRSKCVMIGNEIGSDMAIAANCGISGIFIPDGDIKKIL